ncbi:flavodoxin-dependent (E)-4-hydroxy-3-methylbut-2-enyl-diphosphate synthase [Petrocella sp. FN5]|uniref:flavodoxin-dependent (E)-4-hydroxy-3-methylbut-2-enyl-diphosphate synthase n=1 Tax=Petrocella sp. FN5 TaxID=3032002 RepID=UPI0023DBA7FB|nr:flavodoxin-dependent (E)-4-hydroxy-3-methylbut-2-enyl-diphosphate synthase [Petrocella sp. FN5]MDF1616785.1 flavodoxin-dependent (E)-4-hydroxy-3-methylbut-2-enyl-diphosphate synthase [Petrocella sp. FN5]
MNRTQTRTIQIGNVTIGGGHKIAIQSMTNTKTENIEATVGQILELEQGGCDIIRVAVPTMEAALAIKAIKKQIHIPLVADIHFDYRLALASIENGADKIRINPGNIGSSDRLKKVVDACKARNIPIRVGVNSGSLEKEILAKYGHPTAEALVESALNQCRAIEALGYNQLVVSIKSSDVIKSIEAYRQITKEIDYPLHLGITESGTAWAGTIKSAVGLGAMLAEGFGDTIRVSLTDKPIEEIKVGKQILKALGYENHGIEIISCPTCGRTDIDLIGIANEVEKRCADLDLNIKVAVMGCIVNGPGEAREADIGLAGGKGLGIIFKKGVIIKKVKEEELVEALMTEIMTTSKVINP